VASDDLVRDAAEQLYSSDPDQFIERRGALAAQARRAGAAAAAKRIAGLRKPTRSAWVINQLVRAVPEVNTQLAELGRELRKAQRSLDGAAIRELSLRRRRLIEALVRQAFTVTGQRAPSAALRDEVAATLSAALTDPEVADQLAAGILERAARSEGFGSAGPALRLVPPSPAASPRGGGRRGRPAPRPAPKVAQANPAELAAAREKAARERRRRAVAEAEQAAAAADRAADAAAKAEQQQQAAVRLLEEQLTDARRQLAEARIQARQAGTRQRQAHQALGRLRP
jgi:hypothetical protein